MSNSEVVAKTYSEVVAKMETFCKLIDEFKLGVKVKENNEHTSVLWDARQFKYQNWETLEGLLQIMMLHLDNQNLFTSIKYVIYVEYDTKGLRNNYFVDMEISRFGEFNYGLREKIRSDYDDHIKQINMHVVQQYPLFVPRDFNEKPKCIKFNGIQEFFIELYPNQPTPDSVSDEFFKCTFKL
jgi:hypothetical protein